MPKDKVTGVNVWGGGAIYNNSVWVYPDMKTALVRKALCNKVDWLVVDSEAPDKKPVIICLVNYLPRL